MATTITTPSFRQYVFTQHSDLLICTLLAMVPVFVLFKIVYPLPDFFGDSFMYLLMAIRKDFIYLWPVGYSWCLRFIHVFTSSHFVLVLLQYLALQLSSLALAFTLFYIFRPARWVKLTALIFLVVNPLTIYIANLISSDAFFASLSLLWLAMLVQIIYKPSGWLLAVQGMVMALAFCIRYQGLYYPVLMILALLLAGGPWWKRLASAAGGIALVAVFIISTENAYEKKDGIRQFSPAGGWTLAYNCLYMYPHIQVDTAALPSGLVLLNQTVANYFDTCSQYERDMGPRGTVRYLLNENEPLSVYGYRLLEHFTGKKLMANFDTAAYVFNIYSRHLVLKHPLAYARYFLLPNIGCYLVPMQETLECYTAQGSQMVPWGVKWFQLGSSYAFSRWPRGSYYLTGIFPWLFLVINVVLLVLVCFFLRGKVLPALFLCQKRCLWFLLAAFVCNAAFSILAAPVMLRYQLYAVLLGLLLMLVLLSLALNPLKQALASKTL